MVKISVILTSTILKKPSARLKTTRSACKPKSVTSRSAHGLRRDRRLRHSAQFQEAYRQQRKWVGRFMVLYLRAGEGAALRLGVVASRKVGGAVARARAKRLLREAYRLQRSSFQGNWDVVLVARRSVLDVKRPEVDKELRRLAQQAGLLPEDGSS